MEITYTNATPNDIEAIFNLNKELIDKYAKVKKSNYTQYLKWVRKNIEENIKKYNRLIFNEYHIGYIYFHPTGLKMELDGLFLFTEYRGKGVGKEIVLKCIDESRTSIFLFVYKENIPAVTLYTNIGFEIKRVLPDSRYLMEFNKKSNIINTL